MVMCVHDMKGACSRSSARVRYHVSYVVESKPAWHGDVVTKVQLVINVDTFRLCCMAGFSQLNQICLFSLIFLLPSSLSLGLSPQKNNNLLLNVRTQERVDN